MNQKQNQMAIDKEETLTTAKLFTVVFILAFAIIKIISYL